MKKGKARLAKIEPAVRAGNNKHANKLLSLLHFSLFFLIFLSSCELFTGPQIDIFQQISDEVDWSNAARLTVTVAIPSGWGTSPQNGTGRCFDDVRTTETPRLEYPFTVEFTPSLSYSFKEWRAYATSSMPEGWETDIGKLDNITRLDGDSVAVPVLPARGGTGSFTVSTTEAVTLVPWCSTEPYVTRTSPRHSPDTIYPRGTDIIIYFNGPLALVEGANPRLFTEEIITIKANGVDITNDGSYDAPFYAVNTGLGIYTITISPLAAPESSLIEVTVGPLIYNTADERMANAEIFSFRTYSGTASGSIPEWGAVYDGSSISVNWTLEATGLTGEVYIRARYRIDRGADNPLSGSTLNDINYTGAITNIIGIDASGIRQGRETSGIREYEIFLDLYIEEMRSWGSVSFKIWNITGMSVNQSNPAIEITSAGGDGDPGDGNIGFANIEAAGQYVLAQNITVGDHNPISNFQGKFYGNGKTITITGVNPAADMGLFGSVQGAEIRDLRVEYDNITVNGTGNLNFGGIAGQANGSAVIRNVIVGGDRGTVTLVSSGAINAGIITGTMQSSVVIENCCIALTLIVNGSGNNEIYAGGIAGKRAGTIKISVSDSVSLGNITVNHDGAGDVTTGGLFGFVESSTINDSVSQGNVAVNHTGAGNVTTGGLFGFVESSTINDSVSQGNVAVTHTGAGTVTTGGLFGFVTNSTITNCEYLGGEVKLTRNGTVGTADIGGFAGYVTNTTLNNCGSRGLVKIDYGTTTATTGLANIYAGGFVGTITGDVSGCYNNADMEINLNSLDTRFPTTDMFHSIGGFGGMMQGGDTSQCYSTGSITVTSRNNETFYNYVGGFTGVIKGGIKFEDCYATGNVIVVRSVSGGRGSVDIGGFGGRMDAGAANTINRCFSTGSVTGDSSRETSGGSFAGICPVTGDTNTISNCVALGSSVTGITRNAVSGNLFTGRINSDSTWNNNPGIRINNYVISTLKVYRQSDNGNPLQEKIITEDDANGPNGKIIQRVMLTSGFWSGLGYNTTNGWDTVTPVTRNGYPALKGVGGAQ